MEDNPGSGQTGTHEVNEREEDRPRPLQNLPLTTG